MFPIRDTIQSRTTPVVMWALIAANVGLFLFEFILPRTHLEQVVYLYGLVPRRFTHPRWAAYVGFPKNTYWPFLTSMFLHGGWVHLISNMWMLWIFGDNVEDRMGHVRFLLFYLLCGAISAIFHLLSQPGSAVPTIGASGAIAGVLGAYLLLFPRARIVTLVPIFFFPVIIHIHAFFFLIFWFFTQFYSGTLSLLARSQGGGIAWWAHIGGFLAGMYLCKYFVKRQYRRRRPETH